MQHFKIHGRQKIHNAYILIYERANFINQEQFYEFTEDIKVVLASK